MKNQDKLAAAITYAAKRHQMQFRKFTGAPYILHPLEVLDLLRTWGVDEEIQVAGVLHDVVEDTTATVDDISTLFGTRVSFIVGEVTKEDIEEDRAYRVLHELRRLHSSSVSAKLVKLADIVSNLRALDTAYKQNPEWAVKYADEKLAQVIVIQNALRIYSETGYVKEAYTSTSAFFENLVEKYCIDLAEIQKHVDLLLN